MTDNKYGPGCQGVADVLGSDEIVALKKDADDYAKKLSKYKGELAKGAKAAGVKKALKPKKMGAKHHEAVEEAWLYIPKRPGATLSMETDWQIRWKATYPRRFPPFSASGTFIEGNSESRRLALLNVLNWVWAEHVIQVPREPCPWELHEKL